jgi:transcriptional regulator GlxA family with amidase domain
VAAILGKGLFRPPEILAHVEAALARQQKLGSATQQLVRKAVAYIQAHYSESIAREQIAAHVGVVEDYLSQCFRRELAVSPMNYLTRYRVQQARTLLERGQMSVTEVALAVGFEDGAHFSRVFQREVGVAPAAYRRGKRAPA